MPNDYEKIYREQRHALGEPSKEIIRFFEQMPPSLHVLDVGCGQGRDALAIGRLGHHVVGVDLSKSGIAQLQEDAEREGLPIQGIAADILEFEPSGLFDIILFDRTLHMLNATDRLRVLTRLQEYVKKEGYLLINDQKKNLPEMESLLIRTNGSWVIRKNKEGFYLSRTVNCRVFQI